MIFWSSLSNELPVIVFNKNVTGFLKRWKVIFNNSPKILQYCSLQQLGTPMDLVSRRHHSSCPNPLSPVHEPGAWYHSAVPGGFIWDTSRCSGPAAACWSILVCIPRCAAGPCYCPVSAGPVPCEVVWRWSTGTFGPSCRVWSIAGHAGSCASVFQPHFALHRVHHTRISVGPLRRAVMERKCALNCELCGLERREKSVSLPTPLFADQQAAHHAVERRGAGGVGVSEQF